MLINTTLKSIKTAVKDALHLNSSILDPEDLLPGTDTSVWETGIFDKNQQKWVYLADFSQVKQNNQHFVLSRSSIVDHMDPMYFHTALDVNANALPFAPYHLFNPGWPPVQQARYFVSQVCIWSEGHWVYPHAIKPWGDFETWCNGISRKETANRISAWLNTVEDIINIRPGIYTGGWWWNELPHRDWRAYDLFNAWYGQHPRIPYGFDHATFWQYTDRGVIPGLLGGADMVHFLGSEADFASYLLGTPPPVTYPRIATVLADSLFVRTGPGRTFPPATGGYKKYDRVTVYQELPDADGNIWCRVNQESYWWSCRLWAGSALMEYVS